MTEDQDEKLRAPGSVDTARIALLAGVGEDRVLIWQKHGLFDRVPPSTEEQVARTYVLQKLERAGVPIEVMQAAEREGMLARAYIFEFLQVARQGSHTLRQVCDRTGLDEQFFLRLCDALGMDDPSFFTDAELVYFEALAEAIEAGLPQAVALEICEMWGSQMRFIANAEVTSYDAHIFRRFAVESDSILQAAARLAPVTRSILRSADLIAQPLHRRHLLQAINIQPDATLSLPSSVLPPGEVEVGIAFIDLSGYTALTQAEGDRQALTYAHRLERLARTASREHSLQIVKRLGDGFMLAGRDLKSFLAGAIAIIEGAAARDDMPSARAGLAFGSCVSRGGDYFGHTVNLAARVMDEAEPAEVLVTEEVVKALDGEAFRFHAPRDVLLRGIGAPVRLWRAEPVSPPRVAPRE